MDRWPTIGASRTGGARISPLRASRSRLIAAGIALAGSLLLAVYPVLVAPDVAALPLLGAVSVLVLALALALGLMAAMPVAIVLLGCAFMLSVAARHTEASVGAAVYGAALLLTAELAFCSIQLQTPNHAEPGFYRRQALVTIAVTLTALAIGLVAALLSTAPIAGSLLLLSAGLAAILVMIGIVAAIIWRSDASK